MPIEDDRLLRLHKKLQQDYPLAYEAAQIIPHIGMAAGALDAIDALREKNLEGVAQGVLSMVPVLGRARVGTKLARTVRDASEAAANASHKEIAKKLFKKAGAGENVAEAGDAGYEEGKLRKEQIRDSFRKGGAVKPKAFRGDGIAQRGKTKGRFV